MEIILPSQTSLTSEQKKAVGLLSIGTFLEYFDLMLYVHMAVLLNDLFFPKTDPFTQSLLSAFAFCSAYVMRPVGALIFGYIGDNYGRKLVIILTTAMMALSSFSMFVMPTYAQVGIFASIGITLCRITQGMSSMGEIIGAQLYLTELLKPPVQYRAVSFLTACSSIGTMVALIVATFVTYYYLNWRYAFLFGTAIAIVGFTARISLKETPEFADARRRIKIKDPSTHYMYKEKINNNNLFAFFLMGCSWPLWFYTSFIYCSNLLKTHCNMTSPEIIKHNLVITAIATITSLVMVYLSGIIHPLKIVKVRFTIFAIFLIPVLYFFSQNINLNSITIFQLFIVNFYSSVSPAESVCFKYFPIMKRFMAANISYALSRFIMYGITSFGTIFLIKIYGDYYGLLIIAIPVLIGFGYGLNIFINLEKSKGLYN